MNPLRCLAAALVVFGVGTSAVVHAQGGAAPPPPPTYAPPPPTYAVTPDVRYFAGDGVGYRDGYFRLGLFAPTLQSFEEWAGFVDVRLLLGNRGELGGNAGLGHRYYAPLLDRTLGGYVYFDARDTAIGTYQQFTFGLESLGTWFDGRVNAYVPVGRRGHLAADFEPRGTPFFQGNSILVNGVRTYEEAMRGLDCRVNANLRALGVDIRPFAGAYAFASDGVRDFSGVRGGVQVEPADWAQLRVEVQHDREFGTNVIVGVALSYPLGGERPERGRPMPSPAARLAEPVERFDWIVTGQEEIAGDFALSDPRNDAPWTVFHVSNNPADVTNPNASLGTFENPFVNFAQVRNNADGEELVYVRGGLITPYTFVAPNDGQSGAIFTMNGGQFLYGAGINQPLPTIELGTVVLPALQTGNPVLTPVDIAGVDMRNRTVVSGITVTGGADGIIASNRNNLTIRNNTLTGQTARSIDLTNIAGNIVLADNVIQTPGEDAVRIRQTGVNSSMAINRNTITGVPAAEEAYQIDITDGQATVVMDGNTVNGGGNGIRVRNLGGASINTRLSNNLLTNQASRSIDLADIAGNIVLTDNVIQTPGEDAVRIVQVGVNSSMSINRNTITGVPDDEGYQIDVTGGQTTLAMNGNTITGDGNGIRLRTFGDAVVNARFSNNDIQLTANNIPLQINAAGASQVDFEVSGNFLRAVAGGSGTALSVITTSAVAGNRLTGVIRDNDFAAASGQGKGITINLQGAAVGNMTIRDNLIAGAVSGTNANAHALLVNTSNTADLTLRVHDNDLTAIANAGTASALIQSAGNSSIAVLVQDNNFQRLGGTNGRLDLNQGGTSIFEVDYFGAGPSAGTPVVANDPFLIGINQNLGTVNVTGTVLYQPGSTAGAP